MQVLEQLGRMSEADFQALYESLAQEGFGPLDGDVARAMRFRPLAIKKLPMAQRAKRARQIVLGAKNAQLAYELIGGYLFKKDRSLVTAFLDGTGVKHQDGMLESLDDNQPDAAKLPVVVTELDQKYPPSDVTLYLALCAEQWPLNEQLQQLWRAR